MSADAARPGVMQAPRDGARLARLGLVVLTAINLLNYLDRYVVAAVGESLRQSSLHVSDTQFGLLTSVFIIVYMATPPAFGRWGDRGSPTPFIALWISICRLASPLAAL